MTVRELKYGQVARVTRDLTLEKSGELGDIKLLSLADGTRFLFARCHVARQRKVQVLGSGRCVSVLKWSSVIRFPVKINSVTEQFLSRQPSSNA